MLLGEVVESQCSGRQNIRFDNRAATQKNGVQVVKRLERELGMGEVK